MGFEGDSKPHRLYNAGDRISEVMHYSLADGHDIHCTARYAVEAPEREFFSVPRVITIGMARIHVQFLETLLRADRFGGRGVVLVDANWEPLDDPLEAEKEPVAKSDADAMAKGKAHWDGYVLKVAQQWIDECQAVRAGGGVPRTASGFIVRALKLCGMADPGAAVLLAATQQKGELEVLREQLAEQNRKIELLIASKSAADTADPPRKPVPPGKGKPSESRSTA